MATGTITNNIDLLWTNPNPTASFAAQNISLDLSKYRFIEIEAQYVPITRARVGGETSALQWFGGSSDPRYGTIANTRRFQAFSSYVSFADNSMVYTGIATTVSNTSNIPLKIYGIK